MLRRLCAVLLLIAGTASAKTPLPDAMGSVTDLAGALDATAMLDLDNALSAFASGSGVRIAVLTATRTDDERPDALARRALQSWQGADARAALLLWTPDGTGAIAVSHDLRSWIPDVDARQVLTTMASMAAVESVDVVVMQGAFALMSLASRGPVADADGQQGVVMSTGAVPAGQQAAASAAQVPATRVPVAAGQDASLSSTSERATSRQLSELEHVVQALLDDPGAAAPAFAAKLREQWQALPAALVGGVAWFGSLRDPAQLGVLGLGVALGLFVLIQAWRKRSAAGRIATWTVASAVVLWLLTAFAEMSLLLLAAGLLLATLLWLLRLLRGGATEAADPRATPSDDYAKWLAAQRRPPSRTAARAAPVRPPPLPDPAPAPSSAASGIPRPTRAAGAQDPRQRLADHIDRLHAAGTGTPAFDRVMARWQRFNSPRGKQQRVALIVIFVILFLGFAPAAFLAAIGWVLYELNALKLPNQTFRDFLQQLSREAQLLQRPPQR